MSSSAFSVRPTFPSTSSSYASTSAAASSSFSRPAPLDVSSPDGDNRSRDWS